jgi:hypothetical protein
LHLFCLPLSLSPLSTAPLVFLPVWEDVFTMAEHCFTSEDVLTNWNQDFQDEIQKYVWVILLHKILPLTTGTILKSVMKKLVLNYNSSIYKHIYNNKYLDFYLHITCFEVFLPPEPGFVHASKWCSTLNPVAGEIHIFKSYHSGKKFMRKKHICICRWDSNLSSSDPDVNPRPWLHRKMKNESFLISFASNGLPRLLLKMRIKKVFHPFPKSRPRFTSEPNVEMKELFSKKMSFYEIVTLNYILMQNLLQMCFRGHWLFFTAWNCKKKKRNKLSRWIDY